MKYEVTAFFLNEEIITYVFEDVREALERKAELEDDVNVDMVSMKTVK